MPRANPSEVTSQIIELGGERRMKLVGVCGQGSTATVYRAVLSSPHVGGRVSGFPAAERAVALKLFATLSSDDRDHVLSALAETTRRLASIAHPNIVSLFECGLWRSRAFVVGELVPGVSLEVLQRTYASRRRRLPLDVALFIGVEVGEALAGARVARDHRGVQAAMLHQALSAREVLLSWRGEVKVSDFEMSLVRVAGSSIRSLRGVAGRAVTMAPEVAQGHEADARSDVFSFGVLLRELLVGPRFPEGLSDADAIRLAREGYVLPLTFQPHLPPSLVGVIDRALEIDPDLRYPNTCAMVFDLRREAFAMGVGDGRYFLRRVLEQEWAEHPDEVTADHVQLRTAKRHATSGDALDYGDDLEIEADVVELRRR
jgi:serine/threonine-protein kinase